MKIGIITYWDSKDNYGQLLQCYALQKYLRMIGHNPYLIRYKETPSASTGFKVSKLFNYLFNINAYLKYLIQRRKNRIYRDSNNLELRDFDGFRKKYIKSSEVIYSDETLMVTPPEGEAFICGSDQIWGGSLMYYLPFVPKDKIKIAYAPSFGGTDPFIGPYSSKILEYLSEFAFIGVREASGAKLLHKRGFNNAIQVVDPTLLLDAREYIEDLEWEGTKNNDVFIYLLGNEIICTIDNIIRFVSSNNWNYKYVASQGRVDKYNKLPATIPQWVNGIANSRVVITNSFHCVVFALTFHKPFIFIPLGGSYSRMNDRLSDLLSKIKLESQIYRGDFKSIPLDLDFSEFEKFKMREKKKSTDIFNRLLIKGS